MAGIAPAATRYRLLTMTDVCVLLPSNSVLVVTTDTQLSFEVLVWLYVGCGAKSSDCLLMG
jgi:hypothetical protein